MAVPQVLLSSSTAINSAEKFNVNLIVEANKQDIVNPADSTKNQYLIIFKMNDRTTPIVKLRYAASGTRDTAFTNIMAVISQAI